VAELVGKCPGGGAGQTVDRDPQRRGTVDRGDSIGERGDDLSASGGTVEFGCA
jgi:hypothetical protein